jgi:hypothetical protein
VKRKPHQWFLHWTSEAISLVAVAFICFLIGAAAMHLFTLIFWE